jgi:hypothetical protein
MIPKSVPVEGIVPEADALRGATTGPEDPIAPEITEEVHDDTLPDSSLAVRSPKIQDQEPIRSAPMSETTTTSRGRLELLADDLIDPTMAAQNLESMRWAELWMKVLTPKFGTGRSLICGPSLVKKSVRKKEGFSRKIRQRGSRSAVCFRSAGGLFALILRDCMTTWPELKGRMDG